MRTRSINHQHYVVDLIDDNSNMAFIFCLRRKSDALRDALQVFYTCQPHGITFFALRIDNAGDLVSHEVQHYCADYGIHLPACMDGVAERFFDTLLCMIRSIIEALHLPGFIWNYAVHHACHLLNNCPKYPSRHTPSFKWSGTIPDIAHHCVCGCKVNTHVNKPLGTLEARGEEIRYLRFSHEPHFYHLYRDRDSRVFTTNDVTFVESDIQLPELAGLQDISDDDKRVVDVHADRDDEVD